ncbi:putative GTPase Der [Iris pallida]|uniref:GTPase Der n=1 Tax=Iris pallida TaxID=29817 RepID=A0AAX6FXY6_IRIPA|nr:putative GTPase Der [Iris pallida]KAJ6821083.1 putative GTPase Der [Iris pallida]
MTRVLKARDSVGYELWRWSAVAEAIVIVITLDLPTVATTVAGDPVQLWRLSSSTWLSVVSILMWRYTSGRIGWPTIYVTMDIRKGVTKVGDLRFRVLDSAGLEGDAASDTILSLTTAMTWNVLARSKFAIFLIDVRFVSRNFGGKFC